MKKNNLKNYEVDASSKRGVRYVGIYYESEMSASERRKSGMLQMAAGIAEILLIFMAAAVNCVGTRTVYVIIPLECILFCALYYIIGAYTYYRSDDKMEQKAYERAIENPVQIVTVAIILNLVSCIGQIILIFRKASELTGHGDYVLLVMLFVILVLHIMMWKYQKELFNRVKPVKQEHS